MSEVHYIQEDDVGNLFTILGLMVSRVVAVLPTPYIIHVAETYGVNRPLGVDRHGYSPDVNGTRALSGGIALDTSCAFYAKFQTSGSKEYKRLIRPLLYAQELDNLIINYTTTTVLDTFLDNYYNSTDYQFCTPSGHAITYIGMETNLVYKQNWRYPRRATLRNP